MSYKTFKMFSEISSLVTLVKIFSVYIGEEDSKFEEVPLSCKSRLVSISFVMDGSLWIFHESGVVSKFEPESFELEVIGEQEGGIMAVKWSPDGELG